MAEYRRNPANDPAAEPMIAVPVGQWSAFLATATETHSAAAELAIESDPRGVTLRASDGTALHYTSAEWAAFVAGIRNGEFDHAPAAA
ncbi:DUF397 domain-containing protein [Nocardia sp. Marseille-Q1738]